MSENCAEIRADNPGNGCLCYCGTCRMTYAIYMLGRAILFPQLKDRDERQTTLDLFDTKYGE